MSRNNRNNRNNRFNPGNRNNPYRRFNPNGQNRQNSRNPNAMNPQDNNAPQPSAAPANEEQPQNQPLEPAFVPSDAPDAQEAQVIDVAPVEEATPVEAAELGVETSEVETLKDLLNKKEEEMEKEKKEYMFLMAEFDNFRKRTLRERADLIKTAAEKVLQGLLPIVDDFERGLEAVKTTADAAAVKEGMELIYNKLVKYLADNNVKPIPSTGADFDADLHDAIAMVPADDQTPKGKVKDTVQKGYTLGDKVLRHSKVVVAQ